MRSSLVLALALGSTAAFGGAIIREGDTWHYYKGTNNPPAGWTNAVFDDTTWLSGASGFGYDDDDDHTVLSDMSNNYVSVFIRKTFVLTNAAEISHLTLTADFDDGMVAYLNGVEVLRSNLAAGAVNRTNLATASRDAAGASNGLEKVYVTLNPALLFSGTNVLAASGHNVTSNSSDFSLIVELYTNVALLRGPYLSMQHDHRVTVIWRTDAAVDSAVDYGLTTNYEAGSVSNSTAVRQHEVELPQLAFGSDYFYRVRSEGLPLAQYVLHAPPSVDQPFRFAVISDFGTPYSNTRDVAAQVAAADPDLLLTAGDNVYEDGQSALFDSTWFLQYTQTMRRTPCLPVLGNHDVYTQTGAYLLAYFALPTNGPTGFVEKAYSVNFGDMHIAGMDNTPYDLITKPGNHATQQVLATTAWLSNDLAHATQTWKIAVYHHPPYTSWGSHDEDAGTKAYLVPLFERYGVNLAFQGHLHWYERINSRFGVQYITAAGGGGALEPTVNQRMSYSAMLSNGVYSFVLGDVSGRVCRLRAISSTGGVIDDVLLDRGHPFAMDGVLDSTNWARVTNGLQFHAAIRSNFLYVACRDAGEGEDHFIYLADHLSTNRPANWGKYGTVMQWSAFLADENDNGEHGWYDAAEQRVTNVFVARDMTFGVTNAAVETNYVLEGSLDLFGWFTNFPQRLYASAAAFGTGTNLSGQLNTTKQAPPPVSGGGNSGSNIESNEFFGFNARDIALDPPVAVAASNQSVEAGLPASVNGSGSQSPSGYNLSYLWSEVSGPAGSFSDTTGATTRFTASVNVGAATNVTLQLVVNDTRFDATSTVVVTVLPMTDSDGDGLSDQEEQTGVDNALTPANPQGHTSNPVLADSDGDGVPDGLEALAGTDPTNGASLFEVSEQVITDTNVVLSWSSVSTRQYAILAATSLISGVNALATNLPAVPPLNSYTVPVSGAGQFLFIQTAP